MSKPTIFISPELLGNYKQQISQETSEATAKRKMSSLNRFFDWAQSQGHIDKNPIISKDQSQVFVAKDSSSLVNFKNFFRFGIVTAMIILAFLLLRRLRFPIPFLPAPAQDVAVVVTPPQATPTPEKPIDTQAIIANIKEEVTKLVETSLEWASFIDGNLLIGEDSVEQITLATADTSDGDINLNPDGSGNLNLILEGSSGNQVSALSANLTNGSLYYGYISNNANNPYLIKLDSGSTADTKFSVRADGYTNIDGSLNLAGDLQFSGLTRITQSGRLEYITNYYQTSGNFEIDQGTGDFVGITKDLSGSEGPATKDSVILNFQEVNPSNYDTLVLNRTGGTNDAFALFVDNGNARFDGQLQLGRFTSNPSSIGQGSVVFNTTDSTAYLWNGSTWTALGGGTTAGFWSRDSISGFLYPATLTDKVGIGTTSPDQNLEVTGNILLTNTNNQLMLADDGYLTAAANNIIDLQSAGTLNLKIADRVPFLVQYTDVKNYANFTHNDDAGDYDFRAEGTTSPYLLFLDAGVNKIGINTSGPDRILDILDSTDPQLRLTQADATAYTDFQTNATGDLTITPSGGDIAFSDGTYTLAAIKDQGVYPFWNLAGKTDTGNPLTCAEGDIYYNAFDDTIQICHTGNTWEQLDGGAGSVSLDTAYNAGGTITVDAYDVLFNLNDSTNDYKFTIDNTTAGDIATALAVTTTVASGTFGTAIDVSDADIGNAISLGNNFALFGTMRLFEETTGNLKLEDTGGSDLALFSDQGSTGRLAISDSLQVGSIATATQAYSRFGTTDTSHAGNLTTAGDLLVSGDFEVDGPFFLDGTGSTSGTIHNRLGTAAFLLCTAGGADCATTSQVENTLSSGSWKIENTANVGKAALMVNQTLGGEIFTASASSTPRFTIANNGNVEVGAANTDRVDLNLHGDLNLSSQTEIFSSIGIVRDMYVYDTSKDADGGTWIDEAATQGLSWYTETLDVATGADCALTSANDRCEQARFPDKAVIIGTSSDLFIVDAITNNLWMQFDVGSTTEAIEGTIRRVYAKDGKVYVSSTGTDAGFFVIDFTKDTIARYNSTGYNKSDKNIANRNTTHTYNVNTDTAFSLSNSHVYDFDVQKITGVTFYALATDDGLYVLDPDKLTTDVLRLYYTSAATDEFYNVRLTQGGEMIATNVTISVTALQVFTNIQNDTADVTAADQTLNSSSTTPGVLASPSIGSISALEIQDGEIYYASSFGVDKFKIGYHPNGSSANEMYKTGIYRNYLVGDFDAFYDMDNLTTLDDESGNNADSTSVTGTPTLINGMDGLANGAIDFDNAQDEHFVIPDANIPELGGSENYTSNQFTIGAWVKNDSGDVGASKAFMGTYNGTDGWAIYVDSGDNIVFYSDAGASAATVTFASTVTDDAWTHVVLVLRPYSTSNVEYLLYINGQLVENDTTAAFGTQPDDGSDFYIGTSGSSLATTQDYDGGIDEPFIVADRALSQAEIKSIYNRGNALHNSGIVDATTFTSTTIGDSSLSMPINGYVGDMVEIYGGTGNRQVRSVVSNTATVLTINPAFTTTPDATSDFRIIRNLPQPVYSNVKDIKDNGNRLIVGNNNTDDTGGAFEFTETNPYEVRGLNFYNYEAGITDDAGTAWASTYDDVMAIDLLDDNQIYITSDSHYYKSQATESLLDAVDDRIAESEAQSIRAIDDTGVQRNLVIRSGSYYLPSLGTTGTTSVTQDTQINYGIQFDRIPVLVTNATTYNYATGLTNVYNFIYGNTPSSFHHYRYTAGTTNANLLETQLYWIAMGPYTQPIGADLAEHYLTYDLAAEAGDVIAIDTQNDVAVTRSQSKMDKNAIGIVATKPGLVLGSEDGSTAGVETNVDTTAVAEGRAKTVEVALAGRVPVKVTLENGPIKKGDYLTPASKPGYAMKQTQAGVTIGRALEDFDGSSSVLGYLEPGKTMDETELETLLGTPASQPSQAPAQEGKLMAFVQTGYYWGDDLTEEQQNELWETYFKNDSPEEIIDINLPEIPLEENPTPDSEIDNPLVGLNITGEVFKLENGESAAFVPEDKPSPFVAFAAFSRLLAEKIKSGAIEAGEVVADSVAVNTKIVSPVVETNVISPLPDESDVAIKLGNPNKESGFGKLIIEDASGSAVAQIDSGGNATFSGSVNAGKIYADEIVAKNVTFDQITTTDTSNATMSREEIEKILHQAEEEIKLLAESKDWNINTATDSASPVLENLFVSQTAVADNLSATTSLAVGSDFFIQNTAIDTLQAPLQLQSLALAPIELMAGKVRIDTEGNVMITGNLYVAGKIEAKELKTEKLIIAESIATPSASTLEGIAIETNATAGKATIPEKTAEITIKNPQIEDYTLVYITPTSSTLNNVLYVKAKGQGFFKVGFNEAIGIPVDFNWWVIDNH